MAVYCSHRLLGLQKNIELFWTSNDVSYNYSFHIPDILEYEKTNTKFKFKTYMRKQLESFTNMETGHIETTGKVYGERLIFDILSEKSSRMRDVYIEINSERFNIYGDIAFSCSKYDQVTICSFEFTFS